MFRPVLDFHQDRPQAETLKGYVTLKPFGLKTGSQTHAERPQTRQIKVDMTLGIEQRLKPLKTLREDCIK